MLTKPKIINRPSSSGLETSKLTDFGIKISSGKVPSKEDADMEELKKDLRKERREELANWETKERTEQREDLIFSGETNPDVIFAEEFIEFFEQMGGRKLAEPTEPAKPPRDTSYEKSEYEKSEKDALFDY